MDTQQITGDIILIWCYTWFNIDGIMHNSVMVVGKFLNEGMLEQNEMINHVIVNMEDYALVQLNLFSYMWMV